MPVCLGCSKVTQAEWKFCKFCGHSQTAAAPLASATVGELVSTEVLARRIPSNEMPGLLSKTLEVARGGAMVRNYRLTRPGLAAASPLRQRYTRGAASRSVSASWTA